MQLLSELHALSCGLFSCVCLPWSLESPDVDLRGLYGLSGRPVYLLEQLPALSCGMFFCVRLPWSLESPDVDLHGLYGLSGGPV